MRATQSDIKSWFWVTVLVCVLASGPKAAASEGPAPQEFRNTGQDWVEGIYVFPLPDKAAVDRMRLHIGERFIEAEIREKDDAKKTYEQARSAGKKASLVEQQRANLFTTSVANIAPGEKVRIEIEYLEDVRYEEGQFSIRFPMTLTPRYVSGSALPDRAGNGWSPDTDRVADASQITPPQPVVVPMFLSAHCMKFRKRWTDCFKNWSNRR